MAEEFGLDVDVESFRRSLDAVGRSAIPRAAAETLNAAAFNAQRALTAEVNAVFDRPVAFTKKAFVVVKARHTDAVDDMAAVVRAKDRQAAYLRVQIEGGTRGPGDPGAGGATDVFTFGIRKTAAGGIARGLSKRLSMDLERERGARDLYFAAGRVALGTRGARRQRDSYEANNPPGLFFGVVRGVKGYFRRPRRRLGQLLGKLTLLLRAQPEAHYRPRFDFPGVVANSFRENAASADFARNLDKEIAYRLEKSAGRATGASPSFRRPSWHGK